MRNNPFQPVLVPLIYLVTRLKSAELGTIKQKMTAVKILYDFYSNEDYDFDELLINCRFIQIQEKLEQFVTFLVYERTEYCGIRSRELYLRAIAEYLTWAMQRYGYTGEIKKVQSQVLSSIRSLPPSPPDLLDDLLSHDEVRLIRKFSNPIFEENPFRKQNQNRNFLIVELFIQTGIRLGELLNLECRDIYETENRCYISIVNHDNDPNDGRYNKPALKNNQSIRQVSISEELYQALFGYIKLERRPIRQGKKIKLSHGYLFTSERGTPLATTSVQTMLERIEKKVWSPHDSNKKHLHPHLFRHYFAEVFLEYAIETEQLDIEQAKDNLRAIGGWANQSQMPIYYAQRYMAESANKLNQQRLRSKYED